MRTVAVILGVVVGLTLSVAVWGFLIMILQGAITSAFDTGWQTWSYGQSFLVGIIPALWQSSLNVER